MQLWLKGVKHASDVHFNLIFVHMFDDDDYDNHFGYGKWKLTKTKDQVLKKFKQFQTFVKEQSGKKVKCICFDNGGEYYGPFDVYCKQYCIKHEKTPPKTPQLNGLAKRMNKILLLNTDVQDNIWFDKDVKCDHLRVFGCKTFVHVPKDERSKLDMKTMQLGDGFDISLDDDAEEEQEMSQDENLGDAPKPLVQLRRSNKKRQSSTRSKHIDVRYHWICDTLDAKLSELTKVHINDNGVDMIIKVVPRGKFEACCDIVGLAITST
ncbi:hypothetical protein CR513_25684, partial [Mucuna pruriens]